MSGQRSWTWLWAGAFWEAGGGGNWAAATLGSAARIAADIGTQKRMKCSKQAEKSDFGADHTHRLWHGERTLWHPIPPEF